MKNSDMFYTYAADYQRKRADIVSEYETRLENLETTKGSQYYIDEKGSRPSPGRKKSGRPNAQGKPRVSNPGNSPTRKDGKKGSGKPKK